jgi:methylthioribulose-1-phosphate dehydratase
MDREVAETLCDSIRFFASRHWVPATSSNFSFVCSAQPGTFAVSRSGIDKSKITPSDFLFLDDKGQMLTEQEGQPSAETMIHLSLYHITKAQVVMHTHSHFSTLLSRHLSKQERVSFENWEMIKAFSGQVSHKGPLHLPLFENTQDMSEFCKWMEKRKDEILMTPALLIAGHGLYAWGTSVFEARRHIEASEFLLECLYRELTL